MDQWNEGRRQRCSVAFCPDGWWIEGRMKGLLAGPRRPRNIGKTMIALTTRCFLRQTETLSFQCSIKTVIAILMQCAMQSH